MMTLPMMTCRSVAGKDQRWVGGGGSCEGGGVL